MANIKTVTLADPIKAGSKQIMEFKFREPRFSDYFELGDPRLPVQHAKSIVWQLLPEVIKQYAERLLLTEYDINHMTFASLRDSLAIEKAILGFFREAENPATTSASEENSSSS